MAPGPTNESNASQQQTPVVSPQQPAVLSPTTSGQSTNPSSPFPLMVIAQHDFLGTGEDEISFRKGELVVVMARDDGFGDGWWTGRNIQNQMGLFPAIYTVPYPPSPTTLETQPLSPDSSANPSKRSFSSGSEGVHEGLGIHSDQAHTIDHLLAHNMLSDVEEAICELSLKSSDSSRQSSEFYEHESSRGEEYTTEDDTLVSPLPINPILAQIREWSPQDVAAFLVDRGFKNQAPNFIRHEITGAILLELDLAMLKEVDIAAFGVRFGIMREIEGLRKLCAPTQSKRFRQSRGSSGSGIRPPLRSPARSNTSADEETEPLQSPRKSHHTSPISLSPNPRQHQRQSSFESSTPLSVPTSPRPYSMSTDASLHSQFGPFDPQRFRHRSTQSQDSGFGGSVPDLQHPGITQRHIRTRSTSTGGDGQYQTGRRVDSQDSGLGHSRHTSTDTVIKSPAVKSGHKRQRSSLVTVRAQPPSIPLMEAVSLRNSKYDSSKELPPPPPLSNNSPMVFPGTRSETPSIKPTAKFLITPNSTRSPAPDKEESENGVRLVKSYSQLRRRSSSTGSPTLADEGGEGENHSHRAVLLKNISAKDASATADHAGWLKKRTERGTSIAGLTVPAAGVVGGWKKRWFVLKGQRLSYYHSDKDAKEKGVIDITAHKCVTANGPNSLSFPTEQSSTGSTRKISLTGNSKFIFRVVPPAPGTSRAVTFTPQRIHIFSAENEVDFRAWVEAFVKANIGLDANAPVISSSTVPLISLARAKEMKSRPPALDLADSHLPRGPQVSQQSDVNSDSGPTNSTKPPLEPKSPPLPTPPLAREKNEVPGNFELEIEKALGKVGRGDVRASESEKPQPLLELSIPIGLH